MPPAGHSEADIDSLYNQVQKRLVQSGEWDKFVALYLLKIQVVHPARACSSLMVQNQPPSQI